MVAPPLAHHLTMMPCYGMSCFFHRVSQFWCPLLLSLWVVFSQPRALLSLGLHSKLLFPAPSSPLQQATHDSGWNAQSCGVDHACGSYLVLPSTDHLLHSLLIPRSSSSVPADFPSVRESFLMWGSLFTFSFPPGFLVSFFDSSFLFSSFFHSFRCLKSTATVHQELCGNCSIRKCVFDDLVRSDKFCVLLFCHLDSSPTCGISSCCMSGSGV